MESAIKTTKNNAEKTRDIYRAVGLGEYKDLMSTRKFKGIEERTMAAKEFGYAFFKSDTPVVEPEILDSFNKSIIKIEHSY